MEVGLEPVSFHKYRRYSTFCQHISQNSDKMEKHGITTTINQKAFFLLMIPGLARSVWLGCDILALGRLLGAGPEFIFHRLDH